MFVNKVLLGSSQAHSFMLCLWVLPGYGGLSASIRASGPQNLKYLLSQPSQKINWPSSDLENTVMSGFCSSSQDSHPQVPVLFHLTGRTLFCFKLTLFGSSLHKRSSMVWCGAQINIVSLLWGHTAWLWSLSRTFLQTWNKVGRKAFVFYSSSNIHCSFQH